MQIAGKVAQAQQHAAGVQQRAAAVHRALPGSRQTVAEAQADVRNASLLLPVGFCFAAWQLAAQYCHAVCTAWHASHLALPFMLNPSELVAPCLLTSAAG